MDVIVPVIAACLLPISYAAWTDLREFRIPNFITLPVFAAGLIYAVYDGHITEALIGAGVLFVIMLVPFLMGGMGGGDVKLMAAVGAWFGLYVGLIILLFACVICVIWGVVKKLRAGTFIKWASDLLRSIFLRLVLQVKGAVDIPKLPEDANTLGDAIPFGPCLSLSAWVVYIGGVLLV